MGLETVEHLQFMRVSRKASDIKFRDVGFRQYSKPTRSIEVQLQYCEQSQSEWESETGSTRLRDGQKWGRRGSRENYSAIQDTRVSRFTYQKMVIVQKNLLLLSLLVVFFGMVKLETDVLYPSGMISDKIMLVMSSVTLVLVLLAVVRKLLALQLEIDQRKIYIRKNNRNQCKSSLLLLLSYPRETAMLLSEIVAIIPHPNAYFKDVLYSSYSESYQAELTYSLNDLLSVMMLAKIFLVFRSLISLTVYCSPRMVRLCRNGHFQYNFFFTIKCIQHQHPITFIIFVFTITLFVFAFGFRATEGTVYYLNKHSISTNGYESYLNCIWFTFITMTSLGYGDLTPKTLVGRVLASLLTIFGLTLNSFLVVAFSQYLKMKSEEIRSHTTLDRLCAHNQFERKSAETLTEILKMTQYMSSSNLDPLVTRRLKPLFNRLKEKIDAIKSDSRTIKATLLEENKTENMIHEFEVLKDNFKQVYAKQKQVKRKIESIEENFDRKGRARTRFLSEVESVLNKFK